MEKCNLCWWEVLLKNPSEIYWKKYKHILDDWPWVPISFIYECQQCKATVWCHNETTIPFWTLADKETKNARHKCHELLDPLWKCEKDWDYKSWTRWEKRKEFYKMISEYLNIPLEETHFWMFDIEKCRQVYLFILKYKARNNIT